MSRCNTLILPAELQRALGGGQAFDRIMSLQGEVFRDVPGRRTLRFEADGRSYFAKLHYGVGWREIFKNLLSLRLPIISAGTEWRAIQKLNEIGIPTTPAVAYGCRGTSPASLQSFVITEDLGDIVSLETLCAEWSRNPPDAGFKRHLIMAVAETARKFHEHGLNHRDFYICHFCLDRQRLAGDSIHLYLIDLHRVGIRPAISSTNRMKDLAALYFSALDIGLSRKDCLRFMRVYTGGRLREAVEQDTGFWRRIRKRAVKLYIKFHHVGPKDIPL
ncbi:MAG TPA: lipopolysaccharide core heptose(I) kinase RfaP [Methylophilaceae bacterium]|nr:lipopolysaccharide core heptose(I) kinase RfaP [Methylophilaceae bacterium]